MPGIGSITGNERLGHQATREPAVVAAPHHLPVINTPYAWLWPWRWDVDQRGQTTIPALRSASLEELNLSPQQQRQGVVAANANVPDVIAVAVVMDESLRRRVQVHPLRPSWGSRRRAAVPGASRSPARA